MTIPLNLAERIHIDQFKQDIENKVTTAEICPAAVAIEYNIPIYDAHLITEAVLPEWTQVIGLQGPGVLVIKNAFTDLNAIDKASTVFRQIIAEERAAGLGDADHFAKGGANDRIWNSLQKLCLKAPEVYVRYMANPVIDWVCWAWLGKGYQFTTQVNQVRPGGKAQLPHRDYHLGFMSPEKMLNFPAHVHALAPALTLQGAVAHCDAPVESGTTKLLPYSQRYLPGYMAALRPEFQEYFETHCVQLPLKKGDTVFFNPALFHAAGENRTTDVERMVNLIQVSSAFGRSMESVDRTAMSRAIYPYLAALEPAKRNAVIAATAEGYAFPTNLDRDPPLYGLAPETQQDVLARAVEERWEQTRVDSELSNQQSKRNP